MLLIQLILYRSPKSIGVYKYLMIYISMFEILYAVLDVVAATDFFCFDTIFLVVGRSDRVLLPKWTLKPLHVLFCSMFGVSMAMFVIHFVYRFLVVTGNRFLKTFTSGKLSIWLLSPVLYGIIWAAFITTFLGSNQYTDQILVEQYLPQRGLQLEDVTYIGCNYFVTDASGAEFINWTVIVGMVSIMSMVAISIFTMIYFATMSYRKMMSLVETAHNSNHYRSLQIQLLNSLVAQATIPALLMQGPSSIIFLAPYFHLGSEVLGVILGVTVALYPVLDPLPTLFIIKQYRMALLKSCRKDQKHDKKHAVVELTANIAT